MAENKKTAVQLRAEALARRDWDAKHPKPVQAAQPPGDKPPAQQAQSDQQKTQQGSGKKPEPAASPAPKHQPSGATPVGQLRNGVASSVVTKEDEQFQRGNDEYDRRTKMAALLSFLDKKGTQQHADAVRAETRSGKGGRTTFFATMDGNGNVKMRASGQRSGGGSSFGSGGSAGGMNPWDTALLSVITGGKGLDGMLGGGKGSSRTDSTPDWMPKDTLLGKKDAGKFGRADFFGANDMNRSSRFSGGYLSPEFRENFIQQRMGGLKPGDAGYDRARRAATSAWGSAEKQYDQMFREHGNAVLREQGRKDREAAKSAVKAAAEGLQTSGPAKPPVRPEKSEVATIVHGNQYLSPEWHEKALAKEAGGGPTVRARSGVTAIRSTKDSSLTGVRYGDASLSDADIQKAVTEAVVNSQKHLSDIGRWEDGMMATASVARDVKYGTVNYKFDKSGEPVPIKGMTDPMKTMSDSAIAKPKEGAFLV